MDTDLANIQREYTDVVLPFIAKHPDLWNPDTHTLDLYTQLVAFVMAYRLVSIQYMDLFFPLSSSQIHPCDLCLPPSL